MNFIIKIVEGPNRGAEIALPEGVAVTLGKSDACDVVLADSTLPDEPLTFAAAALRVTVGGETLEPFHVRTLGATAFAIGPADAPWEELKWPAKEPAEQEPGNEKRAEDASASGAARPAPEEKPAPAAPDATKNEKKKRGGCCGCLVALLLLLAVLLALGWFFREELKPYLAKVSPCLEQIVAQTPAGTGAAVVAEIASPLPAVDPLPDLALRHGLALTNRAGRTVLVGDFETRAARLAATAEAYAAKAGVELDFTDVESLGAAAGETLALVGEKDLRVTAVTNRVLVLSGTAMALRRALEALAADLPKLRGVDVSGVALAARNAEAGLQEPPDARRAPGAVTVARRAPGKSAASPALPVCGILTTPYPCLVLKSGARVMEGAPIGDSVILRIDADSVTLTNSAGRFTWKP